MKLRLPQSLKQELEAAAVHNGRSLNSEVLSRLQGSLARKQQEAVPDFLTPDVVQTIYDTKAHVEALVAKLEIK